MAISSRRARSQGAGSAAASARSAARTGGRAGGWVGIQNGGASAAAAFEPSPGHAQSPRFSSHVWLP